MRDGGSIRPYSGHPWCLGEFPVTGECKQFKMLSHSLQTLGGRQVLVMPAGRAPSGAQEDTSPSASGGSSGGSRGSAGVPSCLAPDLA